MAGSTPASPTVEVASPRSGRRGRAGPPAREAWRRFRRHRLALISAGILSAMILVPAVRAIDLAGGDQRDRFRGATARAEPGVIRSAPTISARILLARMIYGGRISMSVGIAAMLVAVICRRLYRRGRRHRARQHRHGADVAVRLVSVVAATAAAAADHLSVPGVAAKVVGQQLGTFILIVAVIGGFRWMSIARLVRAQFFSLREKEFVEAARALGASTLRQVVRHILPNAVGPVIVAGTIEVANAIIASRRCRFSASAFLPTSRAGAASSTTRRIISMSRLIGRWYPVAPSF